MLPGITPIIGATAPFFSAQEFLSGSLVHNTDTTVNIATKPNAYRWIFVGLRNSNTATGTQYPNQIYINGSNTTYLGNATNAVVRGGVSNDGNSSASCVIDHTICRLPTGSSFVLKGTNGYNDAMTYYVNVFYIPKLNLQLDSNVGGSAGSSENTFTVTETNGGMVFGFCSASYSAFSTTSYTNLTKVPLDTGAVTTAYRNSTTSGSLSVKVTHVGTDQRITKFSSWKPV